MLTLGLETSEALGGVALLRDGVLLGEAELDEPLRHAESLLPAVERVLQACREDADRLELVGVNRGPGSFTGLRIGLATAKGLCQGLRVPLVGVDGTSAYRERLPAGRRACVVVPCRLDLVYVRWFAPRRRPSVVGVVSKGALLERIRADRQPIWVVGSAAEAMRADLEALAGVTVAEASANRPSAEWVARLAEETFRRDELYTLEPAYADAAVRGA